MHIELDIDDIAPQRIELGSRIGLFQSGATGRLSLDISWFERLLASVPALSDRQRPLHGAPVQVPQSGNGSAQVVGFDVLRAMFQLALERIVPGLLRPRGEHGWRIRPDDPWCGVTPRDHSVRDQGWKLHVSATPLSAPVVLARCATVLLDAGCQFKFAATLEYVETLTSTRCDRTQGGKFLTVYPRDDEAFRALAEQLHVATLGLPGPGILSDRRYRPDSLVHYRFGVFGGTRTMTVDGVYESRLRRPDGALVRDVRQAWFAPPAWAVWPCDEPAAAPASAPRAVLLHDRFVVHGAIRHSNRGGVYRATDRATGAEVILKQARPHTGAELTGADARDVLKHEAAMLDALAGLGPAPVALFEQGGDLFLAETLVPGQPLRDWVSERLVIQPGAVAMLEVAAALALARQLVDLLDEVHQRGLVCRDFNPNNVMVTPDGTLRLVDLELATRPGDLVYRFYTPGFAAPEQIEAPKTGASPGPEVDLFALGATLFYLAMGIPPALLPDQPVSRPADSRLEMLVSCAADASAVARRLAPAILGLMASEPGRRWELTQVRAFLSAEPATGAAASRSWRPPDAAARLLHDGLDHLIATMAGDDADRLWASGQFGNTTDECNVQHGAAGVLGVLCRAAGQLDRPDLLPSVARAARWIERRLARRTAFLPGLYFGSAGAAWALYDAADRLDDENLRGRALAIARALPVPWPNPDVCHGSAGAGMALLYLWRASGDPRLLDRVQACADSLLAAAVRTGERIVWPIPDDFDSKLAGLKHYGFAHGIAGVATFLLAAGVAAGRDDCVDVARIAGDTLVAAADLSHPGARWPSAVDAAPSRGDFYYHWCSGASGVATFLIRLWAVTGGQVYRDLAEAAALAVRRTRWFATPAACHGLAGNGELLLDLADALGGPYRDWAGELADCLYVRHAIHDGRLVVPDESGAAVFADFNTGLSGVLGFLLRLQHGGPRWWLGEDFSAVHSSPRTTKRTAAR